MAVEVVWNGASAVGTEDSAVEALLQACSGLSKADSRSHDSGYWWSEKGETGSKFCFWPSIGCAKADGQRGALVSSDVWRLNKHCVALGCLARPRP
jgi:hypothetical protein